MGPGVERASALSMLESRRSSAIRRAVVGLIIIMISIASIMLAWEPHEDAAMLFAYSENVANGSGIVFNPGGSPVDGSSDLLFMLLIALGLSGGASVFLAASVLNAAGVATIFVAVWWSWERYSGLRRWRNAVPAVVACVGPLVLISVAGFGTAFFAGLASLVAVQTLRYSESRSTRDGLVLGVLILVLGSNRMEGFALAGLIVLAQSLAIRDPRWMLPPAIVSLSGAGVFILFRVTYFGYPLPNAFYKKGGGALYLDSIPPSMVNLAVAALPWIVLLGLGLWTSRRRKSLSYLVVLAAGWAIIWLALSNEMNYLGRFQFPAVPVLAVLTSSIFEAVRRELLEGATRPKRAMTAVGVTVVVVVLASSLVRTSVVIATGTTLNHNLHRSLAEAIAPYAGNPAKTLAATEAGQVAWLSGWNVIDLWGLNDQGIAHEGYLSEPELAQIRPDLIFAHVPASVGSLNANAGQERFLVDWNAMTNPLMCYAVDSGYLLLGVWERSTNDSYVLYARPSMDDLISIARAVADLPDAPSANLARLGAIPKPEGCP